MLFFSPREESPSNLPFATVLLIVYVRTYPTTRKKRKRNWVILSNLSFDFKVVSRVAIEVDCY